MIEGRDNLMDEADDEFSLQPALRTVWSYRRVILLGLSTVVAGYLAAVLITYVLVPRETLASITFRLTFDGAEQDHYPNGTKFSSADIVSTPVLGEVFQKNDLQRYTSYKDFKDSMFILQANPDLELLSYEYQTKLADTKLTAVDRSRIEEEFRRKRESIKSAFYSVNFRSNKHVLRMPSTMINKVLQDTLSTWAAQTAERKGATRYNISVLSKNALKKEFLGTEEYIVAVDILRTMIDRVQRSTDEIRRLPNAESARLGNEQVALADIRTHLEDTVRFKVQPLFGLIRTSGILRSSASADEYFADRLTDINITREGVRQRMSALQEAFRTYQQRGGTDVGTSAGDGRSGSVTPQVSESFIDRLVQLSTQANDVEYRQNLTNRIIEDGATLAELDRQREYYDTMRKAFASVKASSNAAADAEAKRRISELYADVATTIDQVEAIYKLIAQQNLNPDTVLYSITSPFVVRTTSSLTRRTVSLYFALTLFAAMILIPLACLAHNYFRHWISPTQPPFRGASHDTRNASGHVAGV